MYSCGSTHPPLFTPCPFPYPGSPPRCEPPMIITPAPSSSFGAFAIPQTPTATPTPGSTGQSCKSIIPPWPGHHGGISACFGGDGRVLSFVEHAERPPAINPF